MKNEFEIWLDYEATMGVVHKIEHQASKLQKEISEMKEIYDDLRRNWEGPASRRYLQKMRTLINSMARTLHEMNYAARKIESTAEKIKQEDEAQAAKVASLKF